MKIHAPKDVRAVWTRKLDWDNPSLVYDKFSDPTDHASQEESIENLLAAFRRAAGQASAYKRDLGRLISSSGRPGSCYRARLCARMMVDMAGGVMENAGLRLDPHSGEPFIPGTALKGLARRGAQDLGASEPEMDEVFGTTDEQGQIAFLAAYPAESAVLEEDVLTPHHADYYAGRLSQAWDVEDPIPVRFPVVKEGVEFVFTLVLLRSSCNEEAQTNAKRWLLHALETFGIGAKTSAGYGWFEYDVQAEARREAEDELRREEERKRRAKEEADQKRRAAMDPVERASEDLKELDDQSFAAFAKDLHEKEENEQRGFIRLLRSKEKKDRWKTWKKKKPDLADAIRSVARTLNEELP
jgi:CRISPR-associated protein Cmr6